MQSIDEGMAPIRAVRHAISREVGHDPYRFVAHLKEVEKRFAPQIAAARRRSKRQTVARVSKGARQK